MISKIYTVKKHDNKKILSDVRDGSGIKITVIGDSIPKGLYLQDKRICRIEHSAVSMISARLHLDIENFSAFGQTLKKCYLKGHFDRWAEEHAGLHDRLIISLGGNDCDYSWEEVAKDPLGDHIPNTPLSEFENILSALIVKMKAHRIRPVFTALPPIDSKRYFENVISARADKDRILQFFRGDLSNISRHQECYNTAILKTALAYNCEFIDFRSPLLLQKDYLSYLSDDGIHPNQKGHEFIADFICRRYMINANSAAM